MTSFNLQASALFAAVAGVKLNAAERIFGNLDAAKCVEIEEKNITLAQTMERLGWM